MAFLATLFERSLMGIDVAIGAGGKLHVFVARRTTRLIRLVAFFAGDFDVKTGQRISCLGMVKLIGGFPIRKVVALEAIVAELALMRILVTRYAVLREPEEGFGRVLHFDERTLVGSHVHRRVAFLASDAGMLAFQVVARQSMVELLLSRLPMDQVEVLAVVLQMAANAVFPVRIAHLNLEVIAVLAVEPSGDFLMAVQALEGGRAGAELVATHALRSSGKRLVRLREWTRRDLRSQR